MDRRGIGPSRNWWVRNASRIQKRAVLDQRISDKVASGCKILSMQRKISKNVKAHGLHGRFHDKGTAKEGVIRHKRGDTLNKNLPAPISHFGAEITLEAMRRVTGATSIQAIQQVVDRGRGGWAVRKVGSERATKIFPSQKQAIAFARDSAKKQGDMLYIHSRDGSVQEKATYGAPGSRTRSFKR